jgi:hypothetical protein
MPEGMQTLSQLRQESPVESTEVDASVEQTHLVDALFRAIRWFGAPSLVLRLDVANGARCVVSGDPAAWERSLCDLLTRAADASPEGVEVHVSLMATDEGVRITVQDAGASLCGYDLAATADGPAITEIRGVVEAAGGSLFLTSDDDRPGTRVEIVVGPAGEATV